MEREATTTAELPPPTKSPAEIRQLQGEILELKKKRQAILLAHNYQLPEIQDVADYIGDSLGLAQQAAKTGNDVIVFCGVHFMAETAKILNPSKKVVLPDKDAGCSLEEACPADQLAKYQLEHPGVYTVAYINCSAAVKALSDVICTSGNAVKIVQSVPADREILFVPDENLGAWVTELTGRKMTLWPGNCYAHVEFTHESIERARQAHPDAKVVAHPECLDAVRRLADEVCSTEKMISYCKQSPASTFVIATESGILHRLKKECPNKQFIPAPVYNPLQMPTDGCRCSQCKYMKLNTAEKLRDCMRDMRPDIILDEETRRKAERAVRRMLEISAK